MRIITACILLSCVATFATAADEHRPKKKEKRNLEYTVSHHYSTPHSYHRLDRRISAGPTHPHYPPSQYYPGSSRLHSPYRKGRPHSLPVPPYAVQMEPLVHYSQRDPLYDTNSLSLNADNPREQELLHDTNHLASTENIERGGHSGGTIYIPHKPLIIEKPVYIKEPEPIIEIIIKESNVTLPPLPEPPTPPPQKKKKEEVQVFYVKYKKNPYGTGKNSVIYDKPIPAISPVIQEDHQEEEEEEPSEEPQGYGYNNDYNNDAVAEPPRPSTTLRTIIKPDSEVYHSPGNNVKVTFGKEGFDYDKRSSKAEDYTGPRLESTQHPQARQLSSFSDAYFRSPIPSFFQSNPNTYKPEVRAPQPYRPFSFPPQTQHTSNHNKPTNSQFGRPPSAHFSQQTKYPFQSPPYVKPSNAQPLGFSGPSSRPDHPTYSHSISHPPPPQFQSNPRPHFVNTRPSAPKFQTPAHVDNPTYRQPVPYKPFDNYKPAQTQYQQQRPSFTPHHARPQQPPPSFAPQPVGPPQPTRQTAVHTSSPSQSFSNTPKQIQFRPETHFTTQHRLPHQEQNYAFKDPSFSELNNEYKGIIEPHLNSPSAQDLQKSKPQPQLQQGIQLKENHQQLPNPNGNVRFNQQYQQQFQQQQDSYKQKHQQQQQQLFELQKQQQQLQQLQQENAQQQQLQQLQQQNSQQSSFIQHQNAQENEHLNNLQAAQSLIPAGGELIQSVPKYEQHVVYDGATGQPAQALGLHGEQSKFFSQEDYFKLQEHTENNKEVTQEPNQQLFHQQISDQQHRNLKQIATAHHSSERPFVYSTQRPIYSSTQRSYQSTTEEPSTTTKEPEKPSTTTKDPKVLEAQLPDEVPDELREQLLSSGILNHASISVLDYDKVGDIPLSALPPDQLANFYNAGGAQQIAGAASEQISQFADPYQRKSDEKNAETEEEVQETAASGIQVVTVQPDNSGVKVENNNPKTHVGEEVKTAYVGGDSKPADPVLNDNSYNRYLPLKINGSEFPLPEDPELKGRKITSVVVLAPVTYDFSSQSKTSESRAEPDDFDLIQSEHLKKLLAQPTMENYKKFLDNENKTAPAQQSIILLVTGTTDHESNQKEIFMYDVATRKVNKLNGELSSAFVDAAEANSSSDSEEAASNVIETRVLFTEKNIDEKTIKSADEAGFDLEASASDVVESKVPVVDLIDLETEASEHLSNFVDVLKIQRNNEVLADSDSDENKILSRAAT